MIVLKETKEENKNHGSKVVIRYINFLSLPNNLKYIVSTKNRSINLKVGISTVNELLVNQIEAEGNTGYIEYRNNKISYDNITERMSLHPKVATWGAEELVTVFAKRCAFKNYTFLYFFRTLDEGWSKWGSNDYNVTFFVFVTKDSMFKVGEINDSFKKRKGYRANYTS